MNSKKQKNYFTYAINVQYIKIGYAFQYTIINTISLYIILHCELYLRHIIRAYQPIHQYPGNAYIQP